MLPAPINGERRGISIVHVGSRSQRKRKATADAATSSPKIGPGRRAPSTPTSVLDHLENLRPKGVSVSVVDLSRVASELRASYECVLSTVESVLSNPKYSWMVKDAASDKKRTRLTLYPTQRK